VRSLSRTFRASRKYLIICALSHNPHTKLRINKST
jgi:hypothetical protein